MATPSRLLPWSALKVLWPSRPQETGHDALGEFAPEIGGIAVFLGLFLFPEGLVNTCQRIVVVGDDHAGLSPLAEDSRPHLRHGGQAARVTPTGEQIVEEHEAEEARIKQRRAPFKFSMVGLKPGDEVVFAGDASKRATVVDERHVEYEGVTTSLSALAEELTGLGHALQGPLYFSYEGELLTERRDRMELIGEEQPCC